MFISIVMKVLSLNLWFSDYLRKERTIIFTNYILENKPDVICLQEVIAPVLAYIYKALENVYPHIHTSVEESGYGLAILSKMPICERRNLSFKETRMNRGIIFGKVDNIIIATTHLESEFRKENPCKVTQFNSMIELLSVFPKVIIVGDTNLTKNDDNKIIVKDFLDVYLNFDNSKDKLYTYNGIENPIIKNKIKSRIDRMYIKGDISLKSFDLEKEVIMSDHYAVCTELE